MDERTRKKKIFLAIQRAVILLGFGIGLIFVTPFLPDIGNPEKEEAMKQLMMGGGTGLIFVGIAPILIGILKREQILFVDGFMSWFILPTLFLWGLMRAFSVLAL